VGVEDHDDALVCGSARTHNGEPAIQRVGPYVDRGDRGQVLGQDPGAEAHRRAALGPSSAYRYRLDHVVRVLFEPQQAYDVRGANGRIDVHLHTLVQRVTTDTITKLE